MQRCRRIFHEKLPYFARCPPYTITANVGKILIRNTGKKSFTGMMIGRAVLDGAPFKPMASRRTD